MEFVFVFDSLQRKWSQTKREEKRSWETERDGNIEGKEVLRKWEREEERATTCVCLLPCTVHREWQWFYICDCGDVTRIMIACLVFRRWNLMVNYARNRFDASSCYNSIRNYTMRQKTGDRWFIMNFVTVFIKITKQSFNSRSNLIPKKKRV